MTRYWFDTEFMEDGTVIELLSIGITCDDGRELYMESSEADTSHANEWVRKNVLPHLGLARQFTKAEIAEAVRRFVTGKPEFWAYYGDYDWVVLCQLFGTMMDLPETWPMFAMDVKQLCVTLGNPKLPEQTSVEHNALNDARWTKEAWEFLHAARRGVPSSSSHVHEFGEWRTTMVLSNGQWRMLGHCRCGEYEWKDNEPT